MQLGILAMVGVAALGGYVMVACARGPVRADDVAEEPCVRGVATHEYPGRTYLELAHVIALEKLNESLGYMQSPAVVRDGRVEAICSNGGPSMTFVLR